MMLCGAEKTGGKGNYEKHALRASQVIAAVAKVSWTLARCTRKKLPEFSFRQFLKTLSYASMIYGASTVRISSVFPPSWIFKSIGLERSRLKIPMMDFASMTYLPETRSKSVSNLVRSFTKDFTLSMEFKEIVTVFMSVFLPIFEYFLILVIKKPIFILNGHA